MKKQLLPKMIWLSPYLMWPGQIPVTSLSFHLLEMRFQYEAVHIYRAGEDGKIVEHKAIRDDLTFLAQLGVIEPSSPEFVPFSKR